MVCVLSALYPQASDGERASKYKDVLVDHGLEISDFSFPLKVQDISKLRKKNATIGFHVLDWKMEPSIHYGPRLQQELLKMWRTKCIFFY